MIDFCVGYLRFWDAGFGIELFGVGVDHHVSAVRTDGYHYADFAGPGKALCVVRDEIEIVQAGEVAWFDSQALAGNAFLRHGIFSVILVYSRSCRTVVADRTKKDCRIWSVNVKIGKYFVDKKAFIGI